jgi:UDP-2-acetamido-2-deoxy-ribo-hexuluronate aminotransferase
MNPATATSPEPQPTNAIQFVDLRAQYEACRPDIERRMQAVFDHGQFIMGPEIHELEQLLADYTQTRHCITVSSGTSSLEIALRALGIGPGDEVITVPFSWISSAEVIALVGATPVFCDIEHHTFNMDPDAFLRAITPRTKAVIPVSLFGQMPDLEAIQAIAEPRGIAVIEDGAQSFGASRHGRPSCGASLIGSTSFFPAKPLGCYGDGGALFTNDDALADAMRAIRTHGGLRRHHHTLVGTNARFDTLQAAILLAKWPRFEHELVRRRALADAYTEALPSGLEAPVTAPGNTHVWAQYTIRVPATDRETLRVALQQRGIPTGVYYPVCFHEQPVFAGLGYRYGDFPVSERASREVLSLPMHPYMPEPERDTIIHALQELA